MKDEQTRQLTAPKARHGLDAIPGAQVWHESACMVAEEKQETNQLKYTMNDKLINIANDLTNKEICDLINIIAPRVDVYVGLLNNHCISSEINWANLNGTMIQINLKLSELDDLQDDKFFASAIKEKRKEEK